MKKTLVSTAAAIAAISFGLAVPAASAASFSINEPLSTPGALSAPWVTGGSFSPTVVTASDTPANALRLTDAGEGEGGFAIYNKPVSVTKGIDITFHQAQYGGTGADGISFFVKDGSDPSTTIGAAGGGIGYSPDAGTSKNGLDKALLGIGLDAFGNFANTASDGTGCNTTFTRTDGVGNANAITIRGAGNGQVGYCMLADSYVVTNNSLAPLSASYTTRADADRKVRVVIDPVNAKTPHVTVYYQDTQVIQVPLPAAFNNVATVKIGFASGTGGSTDIHEVWGLSSQEPDETGNTPDPTPTPTLAHTGFDYSLFALIAGITLALGAGLMTAAKRKN